MKKNFTMWGGFSWPLLMGALAFLFAIARGRTLLNDGDTYWHIATGRWILEHGAIPFRDPFSHTMPAAPWTAHEWLSEVLLYLAFQAGEWAGVVILTALAFAAALAYLTRFLQAYLAPAHVLIFSLLALGMITPHLLARPHLLAMPLLLLWSAGLVRACEEGRRPKLWLLGVMVAWANMHGGFVLGIGLTAVFGLEAVWLAKDAPERLAAARRWAMFLALAILAGALTPHGIEGYFFAAHVMGMSYALTSIREWLPPDFRTFQFMEVWLLLLLLAALSKGIRLSPVRLALLLGLVHLALRHARNVELLGLLAPLLLAAPLRDQWGMQQAGPSRTANLDRFFLRLARPAGMLAIVLVAVVTAGITYYKIQQGGIAPPTKKHPVAAIQAVTGAGIRGPVYNTYQFGGYLIFSGMPVFIDGRADMYGDDFMKLFLSAYRRPQSEDLQKLLDKYKVSWTLLDPGASAVAYLDQLPGWQRFYADETAVVHIRDGAVPARP